MNHLKVQDVPDFTAWKIGSMSTEPPHASREETQPPFAFTLRHDMRPGDIGSVLGLHNREFLKEFGFGVRFEGYVAAGLGKFAIQYDPAYDRLWIAEDEAGHVLGSITITRAAEHEAQLRWFVVEAGARGKGIGKALLRAALTFAREQGYASVFLWTLQGLDAALHLYRAAGFALAEETPNTDWCTAPVLEQRYVLSLLPSIPEKTG